jgi:hypothetical protein
VLIVRACQLRGRPLGLTSHAVGRRLCAVYGSPAYVHWRPKKDRHAGRDRVQPNRELKRVVVGFKRMHVQIGHE